MAKKKSKGPRARKDVTVTARAQKALRSTWTNTLETLTSAEQEVEKQVKGLLERRKLSVSEAGELLKKVQLRIQKERKKGVKQLEAQLESLQARIKKERTSVRKMAGDAVQNTLAALNIPSRQEVSELTRKVDELTRKIDRLRKK